MARALRVVLLVLAGAMAAQEACRADECEADADVEETGLMQKRRDDPSAAKALPPTTIGGEGAYKWYTAEEGGGYPTAFPRNGMRGDGSDSNESMSTTPAPATYAGPVWQPGSKMCFIGVCGCGPSYEAEWCSEPCEAERLEMNRSGQVCPNTLKATKMTNYCHENETNCLACNGHFCS